MVYDDPLVTYDGQLTNAAFNDMLTKTNEVWARLGLDAANPLAQTATTITTGAINMALNDNGTTVIVTRS